MAKKSDISRRLIIRSLHDDKDDNYVEAKPAERIEMVWPLTVTAWAFKGETINESRLQRSIVHIQRRKS